MSRSFQISRLRGAIATATVLALYSGTIAAQQTATSGRTLTADVEEVIVTGRSLETSLPQELSMWTMVDQMARVSVNQWSLADERKAAVPPFYLVTNAESAKAIVDLKDGWPGPTGFQAAFKKLWGV